MKMNELQVQNNEQLNTAQSVSVSGNVKEINVQPHTVNNFQTNIYNVSGVDLGNFPEIRSNDAYSIFVMSEEELKSWNTGSVFVLQEDAFNKEYTKAEICNRIKYFTEDAIDFIKSIPALFVTVSGCEVKFACMGAVVDVAVQRGGIKIKFVLAGEVNIDMLRPLYKRLGLAGNDKYNEFDEIHWTIIEENIIKILKEENLMDGKSIRTLMAI